MKYLWVVPLLAVAGIGQPNPPASPKSPLVACRTQLAAEPDRDWLYTWTYDGNQELVGTLAGQTVQSWPGPWVEDWYDPGIHAGWTLPANVRPGSYQLDAGRGPELAVSVVAPPKRKATTIPADVGKLRAALAAGNLDITIQHGTLTVDGVIGLPDWTILRCDGVTFRRAYVGSSAGNWPMFAPANNVSVYGGTFVHDRPGNNVFFNNGGASGLVVADCTFLRCNLGFFFVQSLVRDCTFRSGGCVIAPGGLYWRCTYEGPAVQHAWQGGAGLGVYGLIDCTFRETDRGPVFNALGGDINDTLCVGLRCSGINSTDGEIGLVEGHGTFRRGVYLHTRIWSCLSSFLQFDHNADSVYVADYYQDGGPGIPLWSTDGTIANVTVKWFELRNGAGIYAGPRCTNCQFSEGSIFSWSPSRGNQHYPNPAALTRTTAAVNAGGPTNVLANVRIEVMPSYTTSSGFQSKP